MDRQRRPPGRPSKSDSSNKIINAESFIRTRDSLVTGLATIQSAFQELSRAYIAHTNTILAGGTVSSQELLALSNPFARDAFTLQSALSPSASGVLSEVLSGLGGAGGPAKKSKRVHDPNAPKRPLTPFFLYMQTARSVIAKDLGADASKGAVGAEGVRRWLNMPEIQKQLWKSAYKKNLGEYRTRMAEYVASGRASDAAKSAATANGAAADDDDDDDDNDDEDDEAGGDEEGDADDADLADPDGLEGAELDETTPPPASPKPAKRQRSIAELMDKTASKVPVRETAVPVPGMTDNGAAEKASADKEKSPDRKRKRREGKAVKSEKEKEKEGEKSSSHHSHARDESEPAATAKSQKAEPEGGKERRSKRKRKSEPIVGDED